jgi:hypothetical protein
MLIHRSLRGIAVLMLVPVAFSLPLVIQAADEFQLRGTAETRVGEKLEGWIRFERDVMILKEINGGAESKVSAGQLKSAHLHLAGAVAQRLPGLRGTYCSTQEFGGTLIERIDAQVNFRYGPKAAMPGIPLNRFSVRWEGDIETLDAGTYTFHTRADDGVRLFIDDRLLIDDWRSHPEAENSGSIELEAGRRYSLRLDYFNGLHWGSVSLLWTPPGGARGLIGADRFSRSFTLENPLREGSGLLGFYFRGTDLQDALLSRVDRNIDFSWNGRELAAGLGIRNYSVRWEGELEAPISGKVTLHTVTSDGVRLWVGGRKIIDAWKGMETTEHQAGLSMTAGRRYPFKMEYFQVGGTAEARLLWSGPGLPRQVVPDENFSVRGGMNLLGTSGAGLLLKGGSFLSGTIAEVDGKAVSISYLDGKNIRIARQNIGGLQLAPISLARVLDVAKWKPGCALHGGDYLEASLVSYHKGNLKMKSSLFGVRDFSPGKVAFVKLDDFKSGKANFELHTRSGSRLRADWLMLDGKRALVKDNSFCWINLNPGDVVAVYGIKPGEGS